MRKTNQLPKRNNAVAVQKLINAQQANKKSYVHIN